MILLFCLFIFIIAVGRFITLMVIFIIYAILFKNTWLLGVSLAFVVMFYFFFRINGYFVWHTRKISALLCIHENEVKQATYS